MFSKSVPLLKASPSVRGGGGPREAWWKGCYYEGTALTASYTYTNDNLTGITTGTTTYTLSYGSFSLMSSVKIGSRTLASYSYTNDRNNYLASLDYGNGDSVDYTYDDYGRVVKETFEDGSTVSYKYDNSGALATVTDSKSGRSVTYYYDFTDRLMKVVESGSGYSHSVGYEYDEINNLTKLVETINGVEHSTSYAYDDDNRLTSITSGSASEHYVYDAYSRVTARTTKNGSTTVLTDSVTYKNPTSTTTTAQVATQRSLATGYDVTYTYTYDDNGNILSISDGTNTTSYVYDTSNQLVRENNQAAGKTWTWTYDDGGNITSRKEYAYTTGTLGTPTDTVNYTYDATWGDLLTGYDGNTITSDEIGNMLSDGTWTYTWQNGRELASMTDGEATWNYTYDADGMRISRTNGTDTYSYVYNGGSLTQMTKGDDTLVFAYGSGALTVTWNGTTYYYVTNIQGDVVAILNASGTAVVRYTYDAWGNILSTTGDMANTLGALNPLRYRGYVYDAETGLYYLQSRYYDAQLGRFICADAFVSTGQGVVGFNMFAYCLNCPVRYVDDCGGMAMDGIYDEGSGVGYAPPPDGTGGTPAAIPSVSDVGWASLAAAGLLYLYNAAVDAYRESRSSSASRERETAAESLPETTVIYRYYSSKDNNLAPRPGIDYDGLSFSTKPPKPGVSAVATTIAAVNSTGILMAIPTGGSHVVVVPTIGTVIQWMNQGQESIYSRTLSLIVVEWEA